MIFLDMSHKITLVIMKIKHIVLLKFKKSITENTISDLMDKLNKLKIQIGGIETFSWGKYNSPEGLNQGFTHAFEMIFNDELSRNEYLSNKQHLEIANLINENLEPINDNNINIIAFDFFIR